MSNDGILSWKTLARNLRDAREQLGMTQVQVQQKTGIAQSLISRYERGKDVPSPKHLELLAVAYATEIPDLYGLRGLRDDNGNVSVHITWKLYEKLERAVRVGDLRDLETLEWAADQILRKTKQSEVNVNADDAA